ncbi:MAG: response regulator [Bryobacterales bacterium]|nr:response regulator [Bryobacterales bacterium]
MNRILVVEDNPADVFLIREAFSSAGLDNDYLVSFAGDGEEALEKLAQLRTESLCLVLLDLNLPKSGGFDVLQSIRADAALRHTLVVTWTSSLAPEEAQRLMDMGVNHHLVKPMRLEEYAGIGTLIRQMLANRNTVA